jgi:hypothetical protein
MDLDLRSAMAPGDPGRAALERLNGDLGASMIPVYALVDGADARRLARASTPCGLGGVRRGRRAAGALPVAADRARVERFRERTKGWVRDAGGPARLGFRPEPFRPGLQTWSSKFAAPPPERDLGAADSSRIGRSVEYRRRAASDVVALFPTRVAVGSGGAARVRPAVRDRLGGTSGCSAPSISETTTPRCSTRSAAGRA